MFNFIGQSFNYNTYGMLTFSASVISLSVGLLVLLAKPKSKPHASFFLLALMGFLWLFHYSLMNFFSSNGGAQIFLKLGYLLAVPYISPSVYNFTVQWTGDQNNRFLNFSGFFIALIFGVIMFHFGDSICLIKDNGDYILNFYRKNLPGTIYFYSFVTFFFMYAGLAFKNTFVAWRHSVNPQDKIHFRNFTLAFLVGYTGSIDFFVARAFYGYPFGFVSFSLFILFIAYTIIRHQFLDINLAFKKLSLLLLVYSVLFAFLLPVGFPLLKTILNQSAEQAAYVLLLSLSIGVILSFGPFIYAYLIRNTFWLKTHASTGLAHELKSPLSAIQGGLEMLSQKLDNLQGDKSKVNDYLDLLQKNSDRLDGFVKNLLNIAKIDEGDISVKKMPVDVFRLINKNAAFIKPLLEKKNLTLQVQGRDNLLVNCDEEKIDQVISNLLSNAIKFSDGGKILIQAEEKPNFLLISISDQGRGIPKHLEMQIFNRFFQCDPTQKGSGIGLTIAKAWVEAHGGKIWAESPANTMTGEAANNKAGRDGESLPAGRCGRGTTVRFTLPIVKPSNDLIEGNNTGGSK